MNSVPIWLIVFVVCQFLFNLGVLWVVLFHVNAHFSHEEVEYSQESYIEKSTGKHRLT